jgi:hypothetical protein
MVWRGYAQEQLRSCTALVTALSLSSRAIGLEMGSTHSANSPSYHKLPAANLETDYALTDIASKINHQTTYENIAL